MTRLKLAFYEVLTPTKIRIGLSLIKIRDNGLMSIRNLPYKPHTEGRTELHFPVYEIETEMFL